MAVEFGATIAGTGTGYQGELFGRLLAEAGDVETELKHWIDDVFSSGITPAHRAGGRFPQCGTTTRLRSKPPESSGRCWLSTQSPTKSTRTSCFLQRRQQPQTRIWSGSSERALQRSSSQLQQLSCGSGDSVPAKVAVQAKLRKDGSKKIGLIVDMRRSGSNDRITLRERLVLPRMSDYACSVLDLLEEHFGEGMEENSTELFVIDFSGAFFTMHLAEEDRKHIVIKVTNSWFVLPSALRVALLFGDALQQLEGDWLKLCLLPRSCVSRPTWTTQQAQFGHEPGKSAPSSSPSFCSSSGCWASNSVEEGQRGRKVDWIGGEFTIEPGMLTTKLSEERAQRLKDTLETLDESKAWFRPRWSSKLRAWWPQLRQWCRVLGRLLLISWAQLSTHRRRPPNKDRNKKQIQGSHVHQGGAVTQLHGWEHYRARARSSSGNGHWHHGWEPWPPSARTSHQFDMGGVLLFYAAPAAVLLGRRPLVLSTSSAFDAKLGDPAWQAEWEHLAVLTSLHVFRGHLPRRSCIAIEGDNTAVLEATLRLSSGKPLMNAVAAEIALLGGRGPRGDHCRARQGHPQLHHRCTEQA